MRIVNLVLAVFFGAAVSSVAAIAEVSYQLDIKPVNDKKCVVCHACFDAPCQLNLMHALGVKRGANRQPAATRLTAAEQDFLDGAKTWFTVKEQYDVARLDTINRRGQNPNGHAEISPVAKQSRSAIKRITATQAKELPAVKFLPEVSFIRVFDKSGQREIYTVFRDRMHSNVAFMFG